LGLFIYILNGHGTSILTAVVFAQTCMEKKRKEDCLGKCSKLILDQFVVVYSKRTGLDIDRPTHRSSPKTP
jgi:hypothetical protein